MAEGLRDAVVSRNSVTTKLYEFFSSVFSNETDDDFEPLSDKNCYHESTPVSYTHLTLPTILRV